MISSNAGVPVAGDPTGTAFSPEEGKRLLLRAGKRLMMVRMAHGSGHQPWVDTLRVAFEVATAESGVRIYWIAVRR